VHTVLVVGAGGLLGSALSSALRRSGRTVVAATHTQLDACDLVSCGAAVEPGTVGTVIDCTAPADLGATATAAANLAYWASRAGAHSVYVSCAEVFGRVAREVVESDVPDPATAYGNAKLDSELAVAGLNRRHTIVRTSWLHGPDESGAVAATLRAATEEGVVRASPEVVGVPTYAGHLAAALTALLDAPIRGVVHLASAGDPATGVAFARAVLRAAGSKAAVRPEPVDTARSEAPAILRSRRASGVNVPDWRLGVAACVEAVLAGGAPAPHGS
jgi:dTDP-4-dehydrorhamnose reductase